jgi:hypothetical protein
MGTQSSFIRPIYEQIKIFVSLLHGRGPGEIVYRLDSKYRLKDRLEACQALFG